MLLSWLMRKVHKSLWTKTKCWACPFDALVHLPSLCSCSDYAPTRLYAIGWSDVEVTIQHLPSLCSFFDDVPARWCAKDKWKHRSDNTHDKSMRTTDQHRNMPNAWQQVPSETTRNEQSAHKNKNRLRISSAWLLHRQGGTEGFTQSLAR